MSTHSVEVILEMMLRNFHTFITREDPPRPPANWFERLIRLLILRGFMTCFNLSSSQSEGKFKTLHLKHNILP